MNQKAWIVVKSPRFSHLDGHTICWGACIWCEPVLSPTNRQTKSSEMTCDIQFSARWR